MSLQCREVPLGLGQIADNEIGLADVLVRAEVFRIELERPRIVLEGVVEPVEMAIAVGEQVEHVRVLRV